MPVLVYPRLEPGDTLVAADQQDYLDDVATEANTILKRNIRRNSLSATHINTSGFVKYQGRLLDTTQWTASPNAHTTLDSGANPCTLSPALTLTQGETLELYGSVLVGTVNPVSVSADQYAFSFYWTYDLGAGNVNALLGPEFVYSMQGCNTPGVVAGDKVQYQRLVFRYTHIESAASRSISVLGISLIVPNAASDITIEQYALHAVASET